jgi:class 3 adenylate cyclase/tetratricopeptide (TPR) repeat protein
VGADLGATATPPGVSAADSARASRRAGIPEVTAGSIGDDDPRMRLLPYVPRLALDWLASAPGESYRCIDGTMVFIDVSGFTALTERLARRGRAGAEELTRILDGVFAPLLTSAWTMGGGLVKFGGDALLLWFSGSGHQARACAAAFDMRRELGMIGRLETSAGPTVLRMSVGVHSGGFDYFLVGGSHRELLLTGPQATQTVALEGRAEAGQILVSESTAGVLDSNLFGERAAPGRLLEARPEVGPEPVVEHLAGGPELEPCVPLGLLRHLLSGVRTSEHRMVTVGFLHFLGVDRWLSEEGSEATAEALAEVVSTVQGHLDTYGVTFLASDVYGNGGKLIVVSGAPEASANDEERMLRAVRAILDSDLPLVMRAGVNRGHVFAGDVGASVRRTYTVMGDAVNLAARLMQASEPGQLLCTGPVLERSRTSFRTRGLPPLNVKGKAQPVRAFEVGPVTGFRTTSPGARLPLVGRDRELADLLSAAASAREGRGRCVQLIGEAGIGKTRLTEELRSRATDLTQYAIVCEQYERSTPYWPFKLLLRRLLDVAPDTTPEEAGIRLEQYVRDTDPELLPWLPLLASPVYATVDPTKEVDRLEERFRARQVERSSVALLKHLLPDPCLLVFEDSYWLDVASQGLLRSLAIAAESGPWLLLISSRDVDRDVLPAEDVDHVATMRLAPLGPDETEELAAAASELTPLPLHELKLLAARAGGSPLFLIELVASAREGTDLPESVEAAITAMIDTLEPPDRTLLRCLAVFGGSVPIRLALDTLSERSPGILHPQAWERLEEFIVRETHDRARFRHALIHDVAYEGLPFSDRREIHERLAVVLEQEAPDPSEQAELLALHFLRAEHYDRAVHYSRIAGARARGKAATGDAAKFYQQAMDAARRARTAPEELAELAETLGDVAELAGLYEDGSRAYRIARFHLRADPTRVADLLRKEGRLREHAGGYEHARRLYRAGLRLVRRYRHRAGMELVAGETEVLCAAALVHEGRFRAAVWWGRRAAATAERVGASHVLAHAYYLLEWAHEVLGESETAAHYRRLALPIYEELGDLVGQAKVLNNLGATAYEKGDWDDAIDFYQRARRAADRAGDLVHGATCTANVAELLCQQGDLDRAAQLFRGSSRVFRGAGFRMGTAWATSNLGLIAGRMGHPDEGRRLLNEARESFRSMGAESHELEATARLAEVALLHGDHRSAQEAIRPALERASSAGGALLIVQAALRRLRGYALLQSGDVPAAQRALDEALSTATASGASYEVALTLEAKARLAALADWDDDGAREEAEKIFRGLSVVVTPQYPLPGATSLRQLLYTAADHGPS